MNNLTVPSVLKAWIDQIPRAGRTFKSTPVVGLTLRHRHAAVVDETGLAADACVSLT